jgi:integrase
MARLVRDARLEKREQRLRLPVQKKPHWRSISEGQHIGYYRGARVGKWVARHRIPGSAGDYRQITLGEADDVADADGEVILDWKQADARARAWFAEMETAGGRKKGPYTVSAALDDYMKGFEGKSVTATRSRIEAIIRPALGHLEVSKLKSDDIADWLNARAKSPARLRTKACAQTPNERQAATDEALRRRRSTANRDLTVLKAALNRAYRKGKVDSDDAWRKVLPFKKADAPKLRYLTDDECRRVVNAADADWRPMIQAALVTGARYGELSKLEARDFDAQARTLWLRETKGGAQRAVYLEAEGVELFKQHTAGKEPTSPVFPRPDGKPWAASQQRRPLIAACQKAKIEPAGFHDLRRTYGARLALKGVPMAVIAEAMGHKDERITRKHYAHLSPSYVADTVRANAGGLGIVQPSNVAAIAGG